MGSAENDRMLAELFFSLGEAAMYRSYAGQETPLTVIPAMPDEITILGQSRLKGHQHLFEVRAAELPDPQEEDELVFNSITYVIKTIETKDPDRLVWVLECTPE